MPLTYSHLPTPGAERIPFAQATPGQVSQARDNARQALGSRFLPMRKITWINAFQTLQPDLWVGPDTACIDTSEVDRLTQHLESLPSDFQARSESDPRQFYFRRQPMNCPDEILRALAELEADPYACGPAVYALVAGLVRHHAEAENFYWTRISDPHEENGEDPDQARATLLARVQALDCLRNASGTA
ncbi:hypothetical protein [Hymenobacter rigui]|uniref:Uncharacterized protein n=1 Tax=Hymenobacter rigui TaxID=334424 RepID=A0A3R9NB64_9BACT|nr:hypothetical protein [Hymenobacter rigui]RSK43162.1 hypothetical protein EI291_22130 [Hymenobacter rigui]